MKKHAWIRKLFTRPATRPIRKVPRRSRLDLEALERRVVPATYTVTNTLDDGSVGTLRWAVEQANLPGQDDIVFDNSVFNTPQTINLLVSSGGQLALTDSSTTTITGPGRDLLSISGNGTSRVVQVYGGASATLSGLTITDGNVTGGGYGGGLLNQGDLSLTNCTVSGNTASGAAGGLSNSGMATVTNTVFIGNTAGSTGGGLNNDGTVILIGCTISNNNAFVGGGLGNNSNASLTDCTVRGNVAGVQGGGLDNNLDLTLTNCTVSGNTAGSISSGFGGGGLWSEFNSSNAQLTNCTISGNTGQFGGGILSYNAPVVLTNCTVSGNSATTGGGLQGGAIALGNTIVALNTGLSQGPDVLNSISSSGNNLIGKTDGSSGWVGSDLTGTSFAPLDPLLAALSNYGGTVQTMALLPGSPAMDAGSNSLATTAGLTTDERGFARVFNGLVDIGAFESVRVTVTNASDVVNGDTSSISALIASPGADGISLREAVTAANNTPGADIVDFLVSTFATPQTITLAGGELALSDPTTTWISGPAVGVTISGGNASRIFSISSGATAALSDLTITGGKETGPAIVGGGLLNDGTTTLTHCIVSGNIANEGAGLWSDGVITLIACTITGNTAVGGIGSGYGGGLTIYGIATLTDSTISGNSANLAAGVLNYGSISMTNCTVSGNSSAGKGGGIYAYYATTTLANCTVSGNTAATSGAGVMTGQSSTTTILNSTISGNTASSGSGGGIAIVSGSVTILANAIVAGNSAGVGGNDVSGVVSSNGTNLIGKTDGSSGWIASDLIGTVAAPLNPLLSALGNFGGPTQTMALLPNSPAINAGDLSFAPTTDQRGLPRFGNTDIGAFEYQFKVTNTTDSGLGSLRQAIINANNTVGTDTIVFTIGAGAQTISPTSGLPVITEAILIDGTTQPGYAGSPLIQLDGSFSGGAAFGLRLDGGNSTIRGLIVSNFNTSNAAGIFLTSNNNVVQSNWIGTNAAGIGPAGNSDGILIGVGTHGNTIGGTNATARNIISGNTAVGVLIVGSGTTGNFVEGNYIGTNPAGTGALGNLTGVEIASSANANTIGGNVVGAGNVISGNTGNGVLLTDIGTSANVIDGNIIGLNAAGTTIVKNTLNGVLIAGGASSNRIGSDGDGVNDALERNVISGNASGTNANINILGAGTNFNVVAGNYVGLTADGTAATFGSAHGIRIAVGASFNRIGTDGSNDAFNADERNVISGMSSIAIFIAWGSLDPNVATGNIVAGNWVGLNAAGTVALGNGGDGILLSGVTHNRIGTNADGVADADEANVVVGCGEFGVDLSDPGCSQNVVAGNFIGTNPAGTAAMPNVQGGVLLEAGATNNTIGGTTAAARNIISGNAGDGVDFTDSTTTSNIVEGNFIGTDVSGTAALANSNGVQIIGVGSNTIGGTTPGVAYALPSDGSISSAYNTAVAADGSLIVADGPDNRLLRINPQTGAITVISSGGQFSYPSGVALAANGDIYVANTAFAGTPAILRVNPTTGAQTVIYSEGLLVEPTDIVVAANGQLFISDRQADGGNGAIFSLNPTTGVLSVLTQGPGPDTPQGMALAADGSLYVAYVPFSGGIGEVDRVNTVTGVRTVVSSAGLLSDVSGVAVDRDGSLLVTNIDTGFPNPGDIVRVDPTTGAQSLAFSGGVISTPVETTVAPNGDLYITNHANDGNFTAQILRIAANAAANVISGNSGNGVILTGRAVQDCAPKSPSLRQLYWDRRDRVGGPGQSRLGR